MKRIVKLNKILVFIGMMYFFITTANVSEIMTVFGIAVTAGVIMIALIRVDKDYLAMPTVNQYKSKHSNQGGGLSCRHCGSRSIRNWGRSRANDLDRIFICNHCGAHLYRN